MVFQLFCESHIFRLLPFLHQVILNFHLFYLKQHLQIALGAQICTPGAQIQTPLALL